MLCKFYISRTKDAKDLPLPKYMTKGAAGLDLYANILEGVVIKPSESRLIPAGIKISIPQGFEAQIRPRSGLALKNSVTMLNGVGTIDADYRGEIGVILINHGKEGFIVKRGERIAQMVINKVEVVDFVEIDEDRLDETERGTGGFGHTGV
ncbi:MAG: dUTP diphosphatase [Defluviitaleaceae bacterium]|nr:dUTP diphosphatase [Defluviitaleaceae bacterium]